ncbi:MAG: hypothetical protein IPJ19_06470 [Planctomycetes bacterium]|nr:hypothetical protein [Planctomycetota bacterium]
MPGGLLLGATRGEWGGEVVYLKPDGKQEQVLWENTIGLHRTPSGIVAVTGLAHLTLEEGVLYRIDLGADGSYKATWWKRLPGAPSRSGLRADGTLVVSCRGGTIAVSPDGSLGMASEH